MRSNYLSFKMLNLRPIDAKGLSEEMILMKWNPGMDLLAIVFKNGDITLNRLLSWQRVWRIPFPGNKTTSSAVKQSPDDTIKDIAWRPDGRVLAICYDVDIVDGAGSVDGPQKTSVCSLHNVENGEMINTIHIEEGLITSLGWFVHKPLSDERIFSPVIGQQNQTTQLLSEYRDILSNDTNDSVDISQYLPEMHALPASFNAANKRSTGFGFGPQTNSTQQTGVQTTSDALSSLLATDQSCLNLLAVATNKACIKFYALGLYDVGSIELDGSVVDTPITNIFLSGCMRYITVIQERPYIDNNQITRCSRSSTRNSPGTSRKSRASFNADSSDISRVRSSSFNGQNISTVSSRRRQSSLTSDSSKSSRCSYSLRTIEINTFFRRGREVLRVAKMYAKILSALQYLEEVMKAITGSWEDVLAGLDTKLSSYCSRTHQQANSVTTSNGYTLLTADEFLQLLVIGQLSDNLEKFLHDLSDKGLKKLNQAIEQTCSKVQNLVVRGAQKCCYHLHNDLNTLRGMSKWKERYGDVGLDEATIVIAMKSVGSLLLKLTELQQVINHSLKSAKSFFRWLTSVMNRVSNDSNISIVPNEVLMTTEQDIQFITDFIQENFDWSSDDGSDTKKAGRNDDSFERPTCSNFTLEQVGQYFKNETLTRQKYSFVNPGANFWIDFIKDKPELSENTPMEEDGASMLLFYPHNSDSSLIQEHSRADKLVREAFSSVSINITQTLSRSDIVLELDEFIRGTKSIKTTRLFVETDPSNNHHYCLFMTEECPSEKIYLISVVLTTGKCRLLKPKLMKLDNNIYNDSSDMDDSQLSEPFIVSDFKFFTPTVMSFLLLDQKRVDTYLVQIHKDQFMMDDKHTKWWSTKEISEILTSQDTLDEQSEEALIYIDVNSTSQQRKLNPSIVYRKVKSVVGVDMAVEGQRKLACFTSDSNKKMHLYELESCDPEEELEDEERSQNEESAQEDCSAMEQS